MNRITFVLLTCVVFALLVCACAGSNDSSGKLTIAVVPKGTTHEFWQSVHAGSVKAAREANAAGQVIEIIWKGPLREDDREQQVQTVEGFIPQGVSGIVLAPLDDRALVRPVDEAVRARVPVVVIDSALRSNEITSFVATDNRRGGELAADRIGELLDGRGKVIVLRYAEGSASTTEREEGFIAQLKAKFPNVEIVSSDQYAGATRDTAKRAAENLLNRFGADVQGVFTPNESATAGMLLALEDIGKAGQIKFVGFDASQTFTDAMRAGKLHGFVVQNPFNMGYLGVKTMIAHLRGQPVERRIDTGVQMITPENLDAPASRDLLSPPLAEYLN